MYTLGSQGQLVEIKAQLCRTCKKRFKFRYVKWATQCQTCYTEHPDKRSYKLDRDRSAEAARYLRKKRENVKDKPPPSQEAQA